jgi:hypothetical protein
MTHTTHFARHINGFLEYFLEIFEYLDILYS